MGDETETPLSPDRRGLNRTAHPRRTARVEHEPRGTAGSGMPEAVRVWLLGGFRVSVGSRTVEESRWRLKKAAGLVKLLALAPYHRMHRERVMDLLWPDLEAEAATNNLHRTLHSARQALEPQTPAADSCYLRLRDERLELCPEGLLWVDAEAFEEAAATARHARDPAAYQAAVDLYAGELLPGDRYEAWAEERREGLQQMCLSLLLETAGVHEEREDYEPAIEALGKVVAEEPSHERAHAGLVRLYALSGRRDEALKQYERLREDLRRELAREPNAASRRLHEEILAERFPPTHAPGEHPAEDADGDRRHNLPVAQSSFVGRQRELVELKRALAMTRLLTLTGAGGCGKTRLALETAKDLVGAYPDGVWLVELASLSDPALVPNAVAAALGVREQPDLPLTATLVDSLGSRRMLLVLDNCEHLIYGCARLVDTLLSSCEHLRVLATSRETLGVAGETNWLVPSLTVPNAGHLPAAQRLTQYEAVQLFVERARSRLPAFVLTPENAPAVVKVCRRLDGIPLAIELATARMTALAVEQIAERLEDSLGLLTTGSRTAAPRHQTLRATLAWSYELLSEPERMLFGRLSVFAGGWTLEAAEAVGAGSGIDEEGQVSNPPVLDLLSRLVDKSLVVAEAEAEGALRYRMLEPVRQYGREKLQESQEAPEVRRSHAEHYLALAETAEPELLGADQGRWLQRLRTEVGNLRGALSWSLEPGDEEGERARLGLRLAATLWRFWGVQRFEEGKRWLQTALEKDLGASPAVRAKALRGLGFILLFQQDYGRAIAALDEAVALYKELGDRSGAAFALGNLGYALLHGGYRERLPAFVEEAEASMRGDLDGHARAYLRIVVAGAALAKGDLESAVAQLEESLALCREMGDLRITSMSLLTLGYAELRWGDPDRGARLIEEGARITRELGDTLGAPYVALGLGKVAFLRGRPERAARLWGAAEALREQVGISLSQHDLAQSGYVQDLAALHSALDEASFDAAWAEGRALSFEQAIEYALSADEPAPASVPEESPPALSRREREVALLIARGLTNRRIAEELTISERTVTTHVDHILNKLGATSRAQVAAWIVEQRMLPEEEGPG